MLIVLANQTDTRARAIAQAWAPWGGTLCTPSDLSRPGWRLRVGEPAHNVAVASGQSIPVTGIRGILTRLSAVTAEDLPQIAASDRDYAAAEMTAFLIAFVAAAPCRTLNRPTAASVSGPAWHKEQWIRLAAQTGIPVVACHRGAPAIATEIKATLVGDQIFGANAPKVADWVRLLARAARVDMAVFDFARQGGGHALAGVCPASDLQNPGELDAARDFLLS